MPFNQPLRGWVARARAAPGTRSLPFTAEMMLRTAELPPGAPSDPFDRALIATALVMGIPLVTADRRILAFAKTTRAIKVMSARWGEDDARDRLHPLMSERSSTAATNAQRDAIFLKLIWLLSSQS